MANSIGAFLRENIVEGRKTQLCGAVKEMAAGKERVIRGVVDSALDVAEKKLEKAGHHHLKEKTVQLRGRNEQARGEAQYQESCGTLDRISGKWQAKLATKAEVGRQILQKGVPMKVAYAAGQCVVGAVCVAGVVKSAAASMSAAEHPIPVCQNPPACPKKDEPKSLLLAIENDTIDLSSDSDSDDEVLLLRDPPEKAEEGGPKSALASLANGEIDIDDLSSDSDSDIESSEDEEEMDPPGLASGLSGTFFQNVFGGKEEGERHRLTDTMLERLNDAASDYLASAKRHASNVPLAKSKIEAVQYATAASKVLMFELGL